MEKAKHASWTRFKPSLCKSCWASCCHGMPVEVSIPDAIRLGFLSEAEASTSLAGVARRLKKARLVQSFRPRELIFVLKQKPSGDCVFLDENRHCKVYEKRPEICRRFPKIGPKPGFCPYLPKTEDSRL